jgi:hypothetical protein
MFGDFFQFYSNVFPKFTLEKKKSKIVATVREIRPPKQKLRCKHVEKEAIILRKI